MLLKCSRINTEAWISCTQRQTDSQALQRESSTEQCSVRGEIRECPKDMHGARKPGKEGGAHTQRGTGGVIAPAVTLRERWENLQRAGFPLACRGQMLTSFIPNLPGCSNHSDEQQVVQGRHSHEFIIGAGLCFAWQESCLSNTDENMPLDLLCCSALPYIKILFEDTIHYRKSWVHFSVTVRKKIWVVRFRGEESMCPAFWPCFLFIVWILHHIFLVFSFNYLLRKKEMEKASLFLFVPELMAAAVGILLRAATSVL